MRSSHGKLAIFSYSLINLAQCAPPSPFQKQAEVKEEKMVMSSTHTERDQYISSSAVCVSHMVSWRRRCRDRWSEREKLRLQSVHLKGLMPVCLRK